MKDYVQVPAAELEKLYELAPTGETPTLLCLSRSSAFTSLVLVMLVTVVSYLK